MGLVSPRRLPVVRLRLQKHDKTIYLACVGWVLLDLAVVIGVIVHG